MSKPTKRKSKSAKRESKATKRSRTYNCRARAVASPSTVVVAWLREHIKKKARADRVEQLMSDGISLKDAVKEAARQAANDRDDSSEVQEIPFHMMRPAEIAKVIGLCEATYWRMVAAGEFPRPIPIDRASAA